MSREHSYLRMLEASAVMQHNISLILEAKAVEADKSKNWICNHLSMAAFADQELQLTQSVGIHDKLIEVIEGLAKLENSLARNLKVVINKDSGQVKSDDDDGGTSSLLDLFGSGDD